MISMTGHGMKCGLLLQISQVCVCVLDTRVSCANTAKPIEMPFGGLTRVGPRPKEPCIRWGPDPQREGALLRGRVLAHCNVPTHECTAPAAGECACLVYAADEYIRRREGWQDSTTMRPLVKLPWTLDIINNHHHYKCKDHIGAVKKTLQRH